MVITRMRGSVPGVYANMPSPRRGSSPSTVTWSRAAHLAVGQAGVSAVAVRTARPRSELARRWSAHRNPDRDGIGEHRRLEQAALARDADTAAEVLAQHLILTAAGLTGDA
jgi:DNA-binding GntR family transcriptional regulator